MNQPNYLTELGKAYCGNSLELIEMLPDSSVQLAITSPPFALQRQKEYGNRPQSEYVDWLSVFASKVKSKLTEDGSFVLDIGGAYQRGKPVRSLYPYKVLIRFCEDLGYHLAEEFFWYNPSKLPSPIEWVNKRKIRAKDAVNHVWWFSKSHFPKADVRRVLVPYSDRMKKLLRDPDKFYKPKERPSGHSISLNFGVDKGGAIPSNLLTISNSDSNSQYIRCCRELGIKAHPARFPVEHPEFFIKFLTDPGDLVLDFFAGSNTTGEAAESLGRRWIAIELELNYVATSAFRFYHRDLAHASEIYDLIMRGECVTLINPQPTLFEEP